MTGRNNEVADHLLLISQLMMLDGATGFQVKSFQTAAKTLREIGIPVEKLVEERALGSVDGFSGSTRVVIEEYLLSGTSDKLQKLAMEWPAEAMTMTRVPEIDPRDAYHLYKEQGIRNFNDLVRAAKEGKLTREMAASVLYAARQQPVV